MGGRRPTLVDLHFRVPFPSVPSRYYSTETERVAVGNGFTPEATAFENKVT